MVQLTQRCLSLWLSMRRSWTESGGFRDKQIWTPSSPDINPMDFAIWSILERGVSTRYQPTLDSLKAVIQSAWTRLDEKVVWHSCASVKARLRLIFRAKGGHFVIQSGYYILRIFLKSYVEAFFHTPSGIIFIRVFRWVNLSGPPCTQAFNVTSFRQRVHFLFFLRAPGVQPKPL